MKRLATIVVLLLIIAAAAVLGLRRFRALQDEEEPQSRLYIPRKQIITPEIETLQAYLRIDTSNPPGNETAGARFLMDRLAKAGVHAELIESKPGRGNLYARIKGRRDGEGLLLLNHIDVVPSDGKAWTLPPFEGKVKLNQLYGRGTLDMKGIAICQLEGFLAVARSGVQPERDLVFLAVADEELGSTWGMRWLLEHRPELFAGIRYAINEGGITEMAREQIIYFGIETGSKQRVDVRLRSRSQADLRQARLALEPSFAPPAPERILPEVRRFLAAQAPVRAEPRRLLENVDAAIAHGKFWLIPAGLRELMYNNVVAYGVKREPDGAFSMEVKMYNLPDEDPQKRLLWLRELTAPFGLTTEVVSVSGPAPISSDQTPMFAMITEEVRREYGEIRVGPEILAVASTDSRFLRAHGIACYGLWPYPVDFYETQGIHGLDEKVHLDWFQQGTEVTKKLVSRYVSGPRS